MTGSLYHIELVIKKFRRIGTVTFRYVTTFYSKHWSREEILINMIKIL